MDTEILRCHMYCSGTPEMAPVTNVLDDCRIVATCPHTKDSAGSALQRFLATFALAVRRLSSVTGSYAGPTSPGLYSAASKGSTQVRSSELRPGLDGPGESHYSGLYAFLEQECWGEMEIKCRSHGAQGSPLLSESPASHFAPGMGSNTLQAPEFPCLCCPKTRSPEPT